MIEADIYDRQFKCVNCGYYWDDHRVSNVNGRAVIMTCPRYKPTIDSLWTPAATGFQNENSM